MFTINLICYLLVTVSFADNFTNLIELGFVPRVINGVPGQLGDVPYLVFLPYCISKYFV